MRISGQVWPAAKRRQRGLSMVELMVALLIGTLITGAVLQMFIGSRATYAVHTALAAMQENARFAIEFLSKDLRKAGYTGCSTHTTLANMLRDTDNGNAVFTQFDISTPVSLEDGFVAATGTPIPLPTGALPLTGSDIVSVRFADGSSRCSVDSHVASGTSIQCSANHTYQQGQVLLISDCSHSAVFQQSNSVSEGSQTDIIKHDVNLGTPGNCTKGLGAPVDCALTDGVTYTFPTGAIVQMFRHYTYYIANNAFGAPALYRAGLNVASGGVSLGAQELVEGVENMQLTYGVDTDDDGDADYYVAADTNGDGSTDLDVSGIVSVRVSLLMRSIEDNVLSEAQTYQFNGATVTATDRRLRKVFTATIALRNRVI